MTHLHILLTAEQAAGVAGSSASGHALQPVQLINGDWVLPLEVLNDPHHFLQHDFLAACPTRQVDDSEWPFNEDNNG